MKVRKASPLFLLLAAPALVSTFVLDTPAPHNQVHRRDVRPAEPEIPRAGLQKSSLAPRASQPPLRPYKGTEDAPVDGLDGKPHAGPWVDTGSDSTQRDGGAAAAKPASLDRFADERWKGQAIPERNDGVMDDDQRVAPKKGTTGTEGGISEKERLRKEGGGAYADNRPQEPKAPVLAHSELVEEAGKQDEAARRKSGGDYRGGLELPDDLPDKPHNIPHPEPPSGGSSARKGGEPPVDNSGSSWLKETMPYTEGAAKRPPPSDPKKQTTPAPPVVPSADAESWHEWFHSYILSLTMILVSEIGDKTFLVAALMAMRHSQLLVFSAAFGALIVMTILSAVLGHAVPTLLPKRLTTLAAAILFLVFGAKMLREGLAMPHDAGVGEEMKEVEAELEEKEHSMALSQSHSRRGRTRHSHSTSNPMISPHALESGPRREPSPPASRSPSPSKPQHPAGSSGAGLMNLLALVLSPAWVQTFVMTFLGEWGDRSQIATIAMAAGQDYWWVTLGAITGHAFCTGLAVVGGRALAGRVSLRVVTIGGAVAFLVFGVIYGFECLTE